MRNNLLGTQALKIMITLLAVVIVFHVCVIVGIIPYEIVWAGKLKSTSEMYTFETVSILVNMLLLILLLLKGNYIEHKINHKLINGILWFFVLVFALNTIGNLMAKTLFEKMVFTPLTLISAILILVVLRTHERTKF